MRQCAPAERYRLMQATKPAAAVAAVPLEGVPGMLPTNMRYRVLGLLFALASLTYLDRLCISAAAPTIMDELHFSPVQMGYVFSAFTFTYALFEIPSGWFGDRFGTRKALTRIVAWWSTFTVLTGLAT